jgi:hypothetical protein
VPAAAGPDQGGFAQQAAITRSAPERKGTGRRKPGGDPMMTLA